MAITNAISSIIIIIGFEVVLISAENSPAFWLGIFAILLATINIVGGLVITNRMLKMFSKKIGAQHVNY